ncbi:uncharacterized protein FIBRA_06577 [Fibroporia radiculosa]|uniref:Elongin-A n=1 Tax=Fibroporia radiculosa TaxID=599839 RepID=J4GT03_9APHY|nr:uncharacterized protein FIBRA_06577 [Fibroporia radiculosa]CCM04400.1 predicted protein [Fibroporia radiculosa]
MSLDAEQSARRIPSLVQICQRVAAAHSDSICGLSGGIRYDLLIPILESCSPETLLRLEQDSPKKEGKSVLMQGLDIWRRLSFRTYPIVTEQYRSNGIEEPESWRDEFFLLRDMEAKRFEELGSRLRTIRQEAADRRKETQIKITDRLPQTKRSRNWGAYQPKTLLQKTRSEAARMQKGIYGTPMIPPMPTAKNYRVTPSVPSIKLPQAFDNIKGPFATKQDVG